MSPESSGGSSAGPGVGTGELCSPDPLVSSVVSGGGYVDSAGKLEVQSY